MLLTVLSANHSFRCFVFVPNTFIEISHNFSQITLCWLTKPKSSCLLLKAVLFVPLPHLILLFQFNIISAIASSSKSILSLPILRKIPAVVHLTITFTFFSWSHVATSHSIKSVTNFSFPFLYFFLSSSLQQRILLLVHICIVLCFA